MNGCRAKYSSLGAGIAILASLAADQSVASPCAPPSVSPAPGAIAAAEKSAALPSFASIPAAPTDVRPFQAWRAAIDDTRHVGAETAAQAAAEPWTLSDTQGFVDRALAEASPPAPMTTPAQGDTDAFVRDMIRRATPPPRAKH
jgi:hypothetical protein